MQMCNCTNSYKYHNECVICGEPWLESKNESNEYINIKEENILLKEALSNTLEYIEQVENSMQRMGVEGVVSDDLPRDLSDWDFDEYVKLCEGE